MRHDYKDTARAAEQDAKRLGAAAETKALSFAARVGRWVQSVPAKIVGLLTLAALGFAACELLF